MIEPQDQTQIDLAEYIQLSLSNTVGIYGIPDNHLETLAAELDEGIRIFVEAEIQRGIALRTGCLGND